MSTPDPNAQDQQTETTPAATPPPRPPAEASFEQLVTACPAADEPFLCSQLRAKATVAQATTAWMTEQHARLEKSKADTEAAKAAAAKPGVDPVADGGPSSSEPTGDAVATWDTLVADGMEAGKTKPQAISAAVRDNPEAHQAYLAAYNAQHGRRVPA